MAIRHPYDRDDWSLRFTAELERLWPATLNADVVAGKLWTLKGADGMCPEEAAQRFDCGEFVFLRH